MSTGYFLLVGGLRRGKSGMVIQSRGSSKQVMAGDLRKFHRKHLVYWPWSGYFTNSVLEEAFGLSASWGLISLAGLPEAREMSNCGAEVVSCIVSVSWVEIYWARWTGSTVKDLGASLSQAYTWNLQAFLSRGIWRPFELWQMDPSHNSLNFHDGFFFLSWQKESVLTMLAGPLSINCTDIFIVEKASDKSTNGSNDSQLWP